MKRQLRKGGGIMAISPRENFGIGSSLKRFVRKVIPNEVSEIAVKAAPFVAPFNPAAAAALSGIGTFDQTGSISDAIKSGGLNYAGGQAARFIGGAGFQGNPFEGGLQGTLQNFTTFSSPIGTDTGLGKFLSGRGTPEVQAVGAEEEALQKIADEAALKNLPAEQQLAERARQTFIENQIKVDAAPKTGIFDAVKSGNIEEVGRQAFNLAKKGATELFTKVDPTTKKRVLDKSVAIGTLAFAATYADAKAAAEDLGIEDYTESQYNEDQKLEKKQEYAKNLQNFFTGKKDGGRIGYREGTEKEGILSVTDEGRSGVMYFDDKGNPLTKDEFLKQADEEEFRLRDQLDFLIKNKPMFEPETYKQLNRELMQKLFGDAPSIKLDESDMEEPVMKQEGFNLEKRATGGRIGYMMGSEVPVRKNEGGIKELDYRKTGGFVPIGIKEKADDVPAMLSKNEFVMTADAVRGIGGGSVEKGAEKLYGVMKQAEKVGRA
jgi:hypothetical protein